MPNPIFPPEMIDDSLETYLPRVTVKSQVIYITVILAFAAALTSLPFLYVNVTVQSPGIIRPETEKTELKTLIAGVIDRVFAEEGQRLSPGDPVVRLSPAATDDRLQWNRFRQKEKEREVADLRLLTRLSAPGQDSLPALASPLYRQQYRQFTLKLDENRTIREKLGRDLGLRQQLYDEGKVISRLELENFRHEHRLAVAAFQSVFEQQLSAWQQELSAALVLLSQMKAERSQLEQEKRLHTIHSPLAGTLIQFRSHYPGNYIQPGEIIGVISPDSGLLAECYVKPADIGLLKPGMPVRFYIEAFNFHEWGTIGGRIKSISNDFVITGDHPVFLVSCILDKTSLTLKNGYAAPLKKGMTVQSRFIIGRRSLYQLLYDKTGKWLKPGNTAK